LKNVFRLRKGKIRILFRVDFKEKIIKIDNIDFREKIYEEL